MAAESRHDNKSCEKQCIASCWRTRGRPETFERLVAERGGDETFENILALPCDRDYGFKEEAALAPLEAPAAAALFAGEAPVALALSADHCIINLA
jgi:hypothetical protein